MPSRLIADLTPALQPLCMRFEDMCEAEGFTALITCTWRSNAEQAALYAQGRTQPGRIVTWTRNSEHTRMLRGKPDSHAFDFVPVIAGKAVWSSAHPAWDKAGEIARSLGLEWGGDWPAGKKDMPHVQLKRTSP
jgi:peptidoglycan L-alanyl-D-glutamate endopeptidase CwlK